MVPANQRLQPHDAARGQLHLRLVIEHKLPLLQGLAQVRLARPDSGHRAPPGAGLPLARVLLDRLAQSAQLSWLAAISARLSSMRNSSTAMGRRGWHEKMVSTPRILPSSRAHRSAGKRERIEPAQRHPSSRKSGSSLISETTTGPSSARPARRSIAAAATPVPARPSTT